MSSASGLSSKMLTVHTVKRLKQEDECGIIIYGSGSIVRQLADAGLIDEYQLMVNPFALSNGKSLFKDLKGKIDL